MALRDREPLGPRRLAKVAWQLTLTTLSVSIIIVAFKSSVTFQGDFNGDLYRAGQKILTGVNPYEPKRLATEAALIRRGGSFSVVAFPRYPAPILVVASPLSLLPIQVADVGFMCLCIGAVLAALWLLEVRDWRCYLVACASWPTVLGVFLGNVSPLLFLGGAAAWRWRERLWAPAIAIASVVAAKLFMWPLAVWMLVTRRFRSTAAAGLIAFAATFTAWAIVGFAGIIEYPQMLQNVATIGEGRGCSLVSALIALGIPAGTARVVALLCAAGLLGAAWRLAHLPDGERSGFGLAVIAALTGCPVVWAHYLIVLFIPVALLSPRLSGIWFLPMLAGVLPAGPVAHPELWVSLPHVAIELLITLRLCAPLLHRSRMLERFPHLTRRLIRVT
jgi:hypothetical protein